MQMETIEIVVDPNVADYQRILAERAKKTIRDNRISLTFLLISIVLTVLTTAATLGLSDRTMQIVLFVMIGAFVLNLAVYGLFLWSIKSQVKSYMGFEKPITYTFSPDGIRSVTRTTVTESSWDRFNRITETESDFLLYVSKDNFIPIPKRFLSEDARIIELRNLILANATCELDLAPNR